MYIIIFVWLKLRCIDQIVRVARREFRRNLRVCSFVARWQHCRTSCCQSGQLCLSQFGLLGIARRRAAGCNRSRSSNNEKCSQCNQHDHTTKTAYNATDDWRCQIPSALHLTLARRCRLSFAFVGGAALRHTLTWCIIRCRTNRVTCTVGAFATVRT